jgi:hypothetical protein
MWAVALEAWLTGSGAVSQVSQVMIYQNPYRIISIRGILSCIKPSLLVLTYHLPMRPLVLYSLVVLGEDTYSFFGAA